MVVRGSAGVVRWQSLKKVVRAGRGQAYHGRRGQRARIAGAALVLADPQQPVVRSGDFQATLMQACGRRAVARRARAGQGSGIAGFLI